MHVCSARGGELELDFPFGIVRQLFESQLVEEGERSRLLSGAASVAAPVFRPDSARRAGDPSEGTFAVLHGLFWLTVNLCSERPLMLAVDDLHWCDRASLRFLAYLARRLEDLPIVLVASLRSSEPEADAAILQELTSEPHAQLIAPGPLTAAAVEEVVRDRLGASVEPAFADACYSSTDGNPLLLGELLKALEADRVPPDAAHVGVVAELGPRAASRAVLLRLARLSGEAVQVARAISALGDGAELPVVAELAEVDSRALAEATRELVRAEILRPDPPVGFVHPLVQAAVYHDLAPGERELYHERAAILLVKLDAPKEQIAAHLLVMPARGEEWVVDVLRAAADAAAAKGDLEAAISLLQRALDEPPPPDLRLELLLELGQAEAMTSLPAAVEHLRSAYELADEPAARGYAALGLARMLMFTEAPGEAADIAGRTATELPGELDDLARRLESIEFLALLFGAEPDGDRLERLRACREIEASDGLGAGSLAVQAAWEWTESAGPAESVCALIRNALADGGLIEEDSLMAMAGAVSLTLADSDEAVEIWDAIRTQAHRTAPFSRSGVFNCGAATRISCAEISSRPSPSCVPRTRRWPSGACRLRRSGSRRCSPIFSSSAGKSAKPARSSRRSAHRLLTRTWRSSSIALGCGFCSPRGGPRRRSRTPTTTSFMPGGSVIRAICPGGR